MNNCNDTTKITLFVFLLYKTNINSLKMLILGKKALFFKQLGYLL